MSVAMPFLSLIAVGSQYPTPGRCLVPNSLDDSVNNVLWSAQSRRTEADVIIDVHAHVIPGEGPADHGQHCAPAHPHIESVDEDGARALVVDKVRFPVERVWYSAERRLEAMDAVGLDAEVVSPMPLLLNPRVDPLAEREVCRWVNEFIVGLCEADPRRMMGLGSVPLQDPDLAAAMLGEVRAMGLRGVEVASHVGGRSIGDERFWGFFEEAERLGVPVLVHALAPTVGDRIPGPAMATFGVGVEGALGVASVVTGGLAEACPDLHLAFTHGGGGAAMMLTRAQWFWGRTWNEEPPAGSGDSAPEGPSPLELARRFWYDALVFDRRALRYLIDLLGPSRLMVGSDFAAMPREDPAARTLLSMDLAPGVAEDITWNNCWHFLGVAPPVAEEVAAASREPGTR
ncbi:MAG: amidohydrolase family protein [Acidimicrobiales bacterium]